MNDTIASCSEDKKVKIWKRESASGPKDPSVNEWTVKELPTFDLPVWKVSWSLVGNMLAVGGGDN
jgi:protein transport protein SEC13